MTAFRFFSLDPRILPPIAAGAGAPGAARTMAG